MVQELTPEPNPELSSREVNWIVGSIVLFTFITYLTIGLPLAVLPSFIHGSLGLSTVIAGVAVSAQYFASPINRSSAGRMSDAIGAKQTVMTGLGVCALSGLSLPIAASLHGAPGASLTAVLIGRLILGFGESWVGTGAIVWGIGRVGVLNTARVISLNGMTTYGAIALGAPLGVVLNARFGLQGIGFVMTSLALLGLIVAIPRPPAPVTHGMRMPIRSVLGRVTPYGLALAAGSIGFGSISTFVTLYYASRHWENAALALTAFGGMFVAVRLVITHSIEVYGGYRVAIACLAVETVGLLLLAVAPSAVIATIGAGIAGAGMALLFPALGTELVAHVTPTSRGTALGVFNVFLDLCLGATGPLAGLIITLVGFQGVYLGAATAGGVGVLLALGLYRRGRSGRQLVNWI